MFKFLILEDAIDFANSRSNSLPNDNSSDADIGTSYDSEDSIPDLPSSTTLQHLGKTRPTRAKKHAPSAGVVVR